jgi:hypothetical protein
MLLEQHILKQHKFGNNNIILTVKLNWVCYRCTIQEGRKTRRAAGGQLQECHSAWFKPQFKETLSHFADSPHASGKCAQSEGE